MSLPPQGMKALSIRQPWAWAVIHAGKDIENRSQAATRVMKHAVGQRIFIHAAKSFNRMDFEDSRDFLQGLGIEPPERESLAFGGVIGSVSLAGIVTRSRSRWFSGPCGLQLADPRPCPFFEVRGQLNLFCVTPPEGIVP
jgi:hypothetical protein